MKKFFASLLLLSFGVIANCQKITGTWAGDLNVGPTKLSLVIHIDKDRNGKDVCTLDSPDQGAKGIPATITMRTEDSLKINIPSIGASYEGGLVDKMLKGKFRQSGFSFELNLKPGTPIVKRPQTPLLPFPYSTEEVYFSNAEDTATLCGTLTYPVGYEKMKKSSVPVVIMVSGSGQQNRDEELFQHKPFLVMADYLAKNGIASLRYDDRGVGKSKGNVTNATTYNNMKDAAAGLEYLRQTKKFGKTGVLGHSEGGTISFMLGGEKKPDFIISLAGTGVRGDSILVTQNRKMLKQNGMPEQLCNDYCKVLAQLLLYKIEHPAIDNPAVPVDKIIQETKATIPPEAKKNLIKIVESRNPWMDYFIAYDPAKVIAATNCPVMAINGSLDTQVLSDINLGTIKKLLPANKQNLIKEYPGLNHLFQHCTTGNVVEYGRIEETISPEVLKDIADWINNLK